MVVTYEEIKPYLQYMDFHNSKTLCGFALFDQLDTCIKCQFQENGSNCLLSDYNAHYAQLIRMLKAKHPELFL